VNTLGEGSFGKVVLATGPLLGGPERLCAIKAVKKGGMTSHNISEVFTEKRALMLTADHPFITTLYACFQNKVFINF
jgi:novel protein kinase C epsilon type